jgi:alpha-ketoglutaric semialdehyde dehydrogenase
VVVEVSHFIAGTWVAGSGEEQHNPEPARPSSSVSTFHAATDAEFESALASGASAFPAWRHTPMHERAQILLRTAEMLESESEELATLIAREQGKAITTARGEVGRAAGIFRYFSHDADTPTGSVYASPRKGERIITDRVPLGQILCITPWNVPLAIPSWKIAPALAHGNTVLWKPSTVTPGIAMRLVEILNEAGLPPGVCNLVLGSGPQAERALRDERIAACTFTGSTPVGRHLITVGASRGIEVLAEMGGKNAAIVLADADVDWAARQVTSAAMGWSGQRCTATSRVVVEAPIVDQFTDALLAKVNELKMGDPLDPRTDLGPVATRQQFDSIAQLVGAGLDDGADAITGGVSQRDESGGYYVTPTLVRNVAATNPLFSTEVFGPVAAIVTAGSVDEAFRLANHGTYGLSGSVFTASIDRVLHAFDEFDIGILHVNSESTGADPHVPFGGFGDSGSHHKEMGETARDFFTKTRTIYLRGSQA